VTTGRSRRWPRARSRLPRGSFRRFAVTLGAIAVVGAPLSPSLSAQPAPTTATTAELIQATNGAGQQVLTLAVTVGSGGASGLTFTVGGAGTYTVTPSSVTPSECSGSSGTISCAFTTALAGGRVQVSFQTSPALPANTGGSLQVSDPDGYQELIAVAVAPFPGANVAYPNGALINFAGTIYVFAGGHAFRAVTPIILNKIRSVDSAVPLKAPAGSVLPTSPPRVGTLITTYAVTGNPRTYVVGTDGELHAFKTHRQLVSEGYDQATLVTVPNLGGLTVGSSEAVEGAAGNAYETSADGAIIVSSGQDYVLAGGHAFGIPDQTILNNIRKVDDAVPISGTISATQTGAPIASGVLLANAATYPNSSVFVSFAGNIFPFQTKTQLRNAGYGGTAAITVPSTGGLPVVATSPLPTGMPGRPVGTS